MSMLTYVLKGWIVVLYVGYIAVVCQQFEANSGVQGWDILIEDSTDQVRGRTLLQDNSQPFVVQGTPVNSDDLQTTLQLGWEAQIGPEDNREVIEDLVEQFPYNNVGKLTMTCPVQSGTTTAECTATLIGPNVILTAAHCVYNINLCKTDSVRCQEKCTDFVFTPAYPNNDQSYPGTAFASPLGFLKGAMENISNVQQYGQFDVAVIQLDTTVDIPQAASTMSYGFWGCENKNGEELLIVGYPSDLGAGELMYQSRCNVDYNNCGDSSVFFYDCDTSEGMSGSTVWAKDSAGNYVIKGVHSRYSHAQKLNVGVMFTSNSARFVAAAAGQTGS
eukprot:TRINITY_DN1698_c1_g1_i2.p1 TRINITY_DN1698_c1_g1~~TRINITY_DN1698_c1_g1_i2.p1  ORF type:complete len:332 (+),score=32.17 TRINITY_DN1698_c1_g1_i2:132-1127(+)